MLQKLEGIVIRTNEYGETNQIVTIYTREMGKVGAMARGAKKPKSRLSSISQLFTNGLFLVQVTSGLGTLQQGEIIQSMRAIREDLVITAHAACVVELTDRLTEDRAANPFLYELLLQTLQYMNDGVDPEVLLYIYEIKMLQVAGIAPYLSGCAVCGRTEGNFSFSIKEGGFICHVCLSQDSFAIPISAAAVKLLRLFYYLDLKRLGNVSVKKETKLQLSQVLTAYYDEYSGIMLKSKRFLNQLNKLTP